MSDTIQNFNVIISPLKANEPGFLPRYRALLSARRALSQFDKAEPEDVDQIYTLLGEHISEPADPAAKKTILDALSVADLTAMFDKVMGTGTVNPPKGAA